MVLNNYWLLLTGTSSESVGQVASQPPDVYRRANRGCLTEEGKEGRRWRVFLEWTEVRSNKMQELRANLPPLCSVEGKISPLPLNFTIKCLYFCSSECNSPLNVMFNDCTLSLSLHRFQWWLCMVKKKESNNIKVF